MHIRHLYRQVNDEMEFCFNIESTDPLTDGEISRLQFLLADGFIKETVSIPLTFSGGRKRCGGAWSPAEFCHCLVVKHGFDLSCYRPKQGYPHGTFPEISC